MRSSILAGVISVFACFVLPLQAAETRGLTVIARDNVTGKPAEIVLYRKTFAVIVGIDRYQNLPPDRHLLNAVRDAKGVEAVLRKSYRFDKITTILNEEATKERILELLTEQLPGEMTEQDALFIFWAGHGNQEKSAYGDIGYLIPYDGSTEKLRRNLTMAEIRDTISKKIPAKHIFYVMDACYSGLMTATRSVDNKTRRDLAYLKETTKESARQVLTAGGKNEEALDGGPKGHSVFTGRLIETLENGEDFITANELQASIKEKVFSDARARNHTQTPGYGSLYGVGDFVFIPLKQDKLADVVVNSALRLKEFEKLKKMEADAADAKKLEEADLAKKQAELDALDKQIAAMKGRLGTGAAKLSDNLDAILAMAEQKAEQGKRLNDLRKQREVEELKRQQEIERLKSEANEKRLVVIKADVNKYQKIASNQYAQDMKESAWDALVSSYPEAKDVARHDFKSFLSRFEEIYTDKNTGIQWLRDGNIAGRKMLWKEAMDWVENLRHAGYSDWRLPTKEELLAFSKQGNKEPAKYFNSNGFTNVQKGWYWSSTTDKNYSLNAWFLNMINGHMDFYNKNNYLNVWPVRSGKP